MGLADSNPSKRLLDEADKYLKAGRPMPPWLAMALAILKVKPR